MSMLSNLAVTDDMEEVRDSVGGPGLLDSGVYLATVKAAYLSTSTGGAMAANIHLDIDGREVRQRLWITTGNAKGNVNYYMRDNRKVPLPDFNRFRSLSLMVAGTEPEHLEPENGIMKLWDSEQQKEVPQEVPLLRELSGTQVKVGILRKVVDKVAKNDATGSYEPTGETRELNQVDQFFHAETNQSLVEALGKVDAAFIDAWTEKNEGRVVDEATKGDTANTRPQSAAFAAPAANAATAAPKQSLFG